MVTKKPALPPELLKYAQTLYPDLGLQDEAEQLPDIEEGIAQVEQDYAQKQQEDQAAVMQNQIEPLEVDEEADQEELGQQQMQAVEDLMSSQQAAAQQQEAQIQEAELDATMEDKMQEDALEAAAKQKEAQKEKIPQLSRTPSYEEQVMQLTKEQQKKQDMYDLWEAAGKIGGGTVDSSLYEKMRKRASRPLENLMLEKQLEQQKLKREAENVVLQQQAKDSKTKADPNSDISRMARQALIDAGLESLKDYPNVSYAQLEKLYPTLTQYLYTQISAKASIERAKISSVDKKLQLLSKESQTQDMLDFKERELRQKKEISDAEQTMKQKMMDLEQERKSESRIEKLKDKEDVRRFKLADEARIRVKDLQDKDSPYTTYQKANDAVANLNSLIMRFRKGEPANKIAEGAAFFQYAKLAQGDSSVLRDSDIKNLAGGLDVTQFLDVLARKIVGAQFTEKDLNNMRKVMDVVKKVNKEKAYRLKIKPMLKWAKDNQYDLSQNLDPDIVDQISSDFIKAEEQAAARQAKLKSLSEKAKATKKE